MAKSENVRRSSRIKALVKERITPLYSSDDDEEPVPRMTDLEMRKELENIKPNVQKPVELFFGNDVSGKQLYVFDTPKYKKAAMLEKANLCRTPTSSKVKKVTLEPRIVLEDINISPRTSRLVCPTGKKSSGKAALAQKRQISGLTSSESESVSEPSDFVPSEDDTDDEPTESEHTTSSDEEDKVKLKGKNYVLRANFPNTPKRVGGKQKSAIIHKDYHMKADEYFESQLEKAVTSDRTLERLRNSRLTKEKLEELLANENQTSAGHTKNVYSLTESYTALFPMWHFVMEEGYTVLLHGLGSKRCLINDFHKTMIIDHPTLVINGFFPSLTIKDILDGIIVDLLGLDSPVNTNECITLIGDVLKKNPNDRLYLLIHNIDGIMLRTNKSQDLLSTLANIPNLCILASVDHINAPLLWDHVKRSKYNFFWWDATTFLPYQAETSYESSLLVQQSGALALSSLQSVFRSLTSNAKSIYILLAQHQLSNSSNTNFPGMAFKDLYRAAREGFLVSSDLALRAQLTEFIDHKLAKTKRNIDGVEHIVIPLSNVLLKQFLDEHES